jgi:hypothetical protein
VDSVSPHPKKLKKVTSQAPFYFCFQNKESKLKINVYIEMFVKLSCIRLGQDRSISTVTGLGLVVWGSIPGRDQYFSVHHQSRPALGSGPGRRGRKPVTDRLSYDTATLHLR